MQKKIVRKRKNVSEKFPLVFIGPALFLLVLFSIVPILIAVLIGFTNLNLAGLLDYSKIVFTGFENYRKLFMDREFLQALGNTFTFVLMGVPAAIVLSLGIAMLLNVGEKGLFGTYRMVYYLPYLTNVIAISVVFSYLFHSQYGLLNYLLSLLGLGKVPWLLEPFTARISVTILAVWRGLGINILIFLAALKNIPASLIEAAQIDGAGRVRRFFSITLPSIRYAMFYVTMTSVIIWFKLFEESFILTQGGPIGATRSVVMYTYEGAFTTNRIGLASAASMVLFVIIFTVTVFQNIVKNRE